MATNILSQEHWTTLIKEDDVDVLEWLCCVNKDKLIVCYMHNVQNVLHIHHLKDGQRHKTLPLDIGSIMGFSGEKKYDEVIFPII